MIGLQFPEHNQEHAAIVERETSHEAGKEAEEDGKGNGQAED